MNGSKEIESRRKYVMAWNSTMIEIWKEQITLLDAIDTGALLDSVVALQVDADGRFFNIHLTQEFISYGIFVDAGTGKEVSRGNNGDIGRDKARTSKKWFSTKYYSSTMNIRDFLADSLGKEFIGVISNTFNDKSFRQSLIK